MSVQARVRNKTSDDTKGENAEKIGKKIKKERKFFFLRLNSTEQFLKMYK